MGATLVTTTIRTHITGRVADGTSTRIARHVRIRRARTHRGGQNVLLREYTLEDARTALNSFQET